MATPTSPTSPASPTMADIAARLGVSRQLVSIVLRDRPGASDETRARVRAAAAELGYTPHVGAQTLRQAQSRHLGVTFAPAHATDPDIVEAMYAAAADAGYHLVLAAQTSARGTAQAVEELLGYRCAAIVSVGPDLPPAAMRTLAARVGVPLVAVGAGAHNPAYDVVRSAGDDGIGLAVAHLLSLGHREIAYVHAPGMPVADIRLAGYLAAAGPPDVVEVEDDYTEEAGSTAARRLLARDRLPTAVVTGNDQQAVGLLQTLARRGIDVPGRVSVTGFDDSRMAQLSAFDLTSVRQDPQAMGRAAVETAVGRIDDPGTAPRVRVVETTLVVRSSTASVC